MPDINFDTRAQRFRERIYGGRKGQLRLALAWDAMQPALQDLAGAPAQTWDAGGGLGQISAQLADAGHRVVLSDISAEMLSAAEEYLAGRTGIERRHAAIQELAGEFPAQFDLVVCHAVLEWLEQPLSVLPQLSASLKPGAWLSLMFYNRHALVLRKLRRGDLVGASGSQIGASTADAERGFTPPNPMAPDDVVEALRDTGLTVVEERGIRVVYELMPEHRRDSVDWALLMENETRFGSEAPFKQLARYYHVLCRKP